MMETDIKDFIEERLPDLRGRLFPVMVTDISKTNIAYTFTDLQAGHVNQSQLTLNVIGEDYDECLEIHERIKGILAMEEDEPFVKYKGTYFHSELSSGGGRLFNEDLSRWEISKYYILDWRN